MAKTTLGSGNVQREPKSKFQTFVHIFAPNIGRFSKVFH